jgi:uncharacterized membrane protein
MKKYFAAIRRITITGLLFLVPVYVLVLIVTQALTSLNSMGTRIATMLGLTSILGIGAPSVLSGVLLVLLCFACGLIAHVSVVAALRTRIDGLLATYIPGYVKHRSIVEEKLQGKMPSLSYTSALIKQQEFWRPAYVVEQDAEGNCVVFVPDVPDTSTGTIVLARRHDVLLMPSLSANDLDAALNRRGAGLATEHRIQSQIISL